jgi:chromosomal replication initiation ATPase DnaA
MRLQSAGVDLSRVIAAVCAHFGIDEKELVSASKRPNLAHGRAVVSHIATQGLSISGSDVARRLNVDRSAVSRAVRRVGDDPDLIGTAGSILRKLGLIDPEISQH